MQIAEEVKVCPQCAETVQAAAKVCRYCQHRFDEAADAGDMDTLSFWGYLTAVIFPPAALIIGIILMTRGKVGTGVTVIAIPVVLWFGLGFFIFGGLGQPSPY